MLELSGECREEMIESGRWTSSGSAALDFSRVLGNPGGGGGGSSSSDVPESSVANSSVLEGDGAASLARVAFSEFRCEEASFGVSVRRDKESGLSMRICVCAEDLAPVALGAMLHLDAALDRRPGRASVEGVCFSGHVAGLCFLLGLEVISSKGDAAALLESPSTGGAFAWCSAALLQSS